MNDIEKALRKMIVLLTEIRDTLAAMEGRDDNNDANDNQEADDDET